MKRSYKKIVRRGIPIKFQFNHGNAFAFYFSDPEGNLIEVYWRTGLVYPQPFAQATDLTKTEEDLLEELKVLTSQKDSTSAPLRKKSPDAAKQSAAADSWPL